MSSLLAAELAATCNALGYYDGSRYHTDVHTLDTVKDLIRFLRRDDETHEIRRYLGQTKVLQTDLLYMIKDHWEDETLFDVLLRLLCNLTHPALLLYKEELPDEKTTRNYYLQLVTYLQEYKQAFADSNVWGVFSNNLSKLLEIEWQERGEEKGLIIERLLTLVRNVLHVPADTESEKRPDNDASLHDQILWALHQSNMVDLFLYMATSENEQPYYMHILEITSLMFREQSATCLADSALQRSVTEKKQDDAELASIRKKEVAEKQRKTKLYNGARHSRFGGTFVIKNVKSITNNDLIYHKPLSKLDSLNFDLEKSKVKCPKNKLPIQGENLERRSAFGIRLFLKEFCIEFLNGAYNTLMFNVKDNLLRARAQPHDESYYLWAIRFFMEFNRLYKFEVKLVSETMSVQTFHYVQQQIETYFDMINSDKKKIPQWSRRLHLGLKAYRELLLTLSAMDKSLDGTVRDSSKVIKSNIFYVLEYREILLTMILCFDETKMSRLYLKDLLETQHIFMKMLESFCREGTGMVVQAKKKRKSNKKKKSATQKSKPKEPTKNINEQWDEISPQVSAVLQGDVNLPNDIVPFDATSDVDIDDQKADALKKIHSHLRQFKFEEAIALLRASREVWPENDCFGSSLISPEDELLLLREIFSTEVQDYDQSAADNANPSETQFESSDEDVEENEEDDLVNNMCISETDFKFEDFVNRFANPKVVKACAIVLKDFDRNSAEMNHCVVKLLHRIAWDCKMPAMLFQASIFRTFQKILKSNVAPDYKEIAKFAVFIIRKFVEIAQKNPKIYMEMLFWKNSREAFDVECGYGSYSESSGASKKAWTELEEDELRTLFMEHREKKIEEDVVDWISENRIDNTKTRRMVLKKLKDMCLLSDYKKSSKRPPKEWVQEEIDQLRILFDENRNAMDPLGCIVDRLTVRRSKQRVVEKLLELGLIQDKKEVYKKRVRKSQGGEFHGGNDSDNSNSSSDDNLNSDSDSDDDRAKQTTSSRKGPGKSRPSSNKKVSDQELARILLNLTESGLKEALKWLHESFSEAADDLEQDDSQDDEGVPLVPISEESVVAMENQTFIKLLKAFGISKPLTEQEAYWRIPSNLTLATLRKHCELLNEAIEDRLTIPEEVNEQNNQNESSDEDVFSKIRSIIRKNNEDDSEKENEEPVKSLNKSQPKVLKTNEEISNLINEDDNVEINTSNQRRSRILHENDSDSDTENNVNSQPKDVSMILDEVDSNIKENDNDNKSSSPQQSANIFDDDSNDSNLYNKNKQVTKKSKIITDSDSENEVNDIPDNVADNIVSNPLKDYVKSNQLKRKSRIISNIDSDSDKEEEYKENEDNSVGGSLDKASNSESIEKRKFNIIDSDSDNEDKQIDKSIEDKSRNTKRLKIILSDDED